MRFQYYEKNYNQQNSISFDVFEFITFDNQMSFDFNEHFIVRKNKNHFII